jgi:hypothetical protein
MSGKTKAELLSEIKALRLELACKDDYIKTLEYLLDSSDRDYKAVHAAFENNIEQVITLTNERLELQHKRHKPRFIAKENKNKKWDYLVERFIYYRRDKGETLAYARRDANSDVEVKFGEGYKTNIYGKSSTLYKLTDDLIR